MDRFSSFLASGYKGVAALDTCATLQWLAFYVIIAFALISIVSIFIYLQSRSFGRVLFNRKQEKLHREFKSQIEELNKMLQLSDMKQEGLRNSISNLRDRITLLDNKVHVLSDEVKKLSWKKKLGRPRKDSVRKEVNK